MNQRTDEQIEKDINKILNLVKESIEVSRNLNGDRQTFSLLLVYMLLISSHPRGMKYILKVGKDIIANTNVLQTIKDDNIDEYNYICNVFNEIINEKYLKDFKNIPINNFNKENQLIKDDELNPIGAILDNLYTCVERSIDLNAPSLGSIFTTLIGLISIDNIDGLRFICDACTDLIKTRKIMDQVKEKNNSAFVLMQEWSKQMVLIINR